MTPQCSTYEPSNFPYPTRHNVSLSVSALASKLGILPPLPPWMLFLRQMASIPSLPPLSDTMLTSRTQIATEVRSREYMVVSQLGLSCLLLFSFKIFTSSSMWLGKWTHLQVSSSRRLQPTCWKMRTCSLTVYIYGKVCIVTAFALAVSVQSILICERNTPED